jgi:flagellar motility protein MotE (MotC chaperone)
MFKFLRITLTLLTLMFAAAFLGLLAFGGVAYVTGWVTGEKIDIVRLGLAGKLVKPVPPEPPKDLTERYDMAAVEEAKKALEDLRKQQESLALELNERRSQLAALDGEAARIRRETASARSTLAKEQKRFDEIKLAYENQLKSDGFKKTKETFENMKPRGAAELLYDYDVALTVELLKAFKKDFRASVVGEMRRIDESRASTGAKGKVPELIKLIYQGEPTAVTLKPE